VWNAVTGALHTPLLGHRGRVTSVGFGADGGWVFTSGDDGTTRTWSLGADPELRTVAQGTSPVRDVAASRNGAVVADARADGTVTVQTAEGRSLLGVRLAGPATSVALSDDGRRLLATGEDGSIVVWAVPTGTKLASFDHGAAVTAGVFLPDALGVVAAGRDGRVRSWDIGTRRGRVVVHENGPISDVAVSRDGLLLATAVGDLAHVRAMAGGRAVVFRGHRDAVTSVSFSPEGKRLLTTSFDHDASLWNATTGERLKTLVGHVAVVRSAAFSPDGRWIVTAGPTRAGLWEVGTSTLVDSRLYYLAGHRGALNAVALVGPRWRVFTGGADGTVRRYGCRLCAGTDALRRIASAKLERLDHDAKR
jgi:WD40 repeat protein